MDRFAVCIPVKKARSANIPTAETDRLMIAKLTSDTSRTLIVFKAPAMFDVAKLAAPRPELVRLDIKRTMNLHQKITIGLSDSGAGRHENHCNLRILD